MPEPATKLEVEIKFRVEDAVALAARLPALGFHLETPRALEHNRLFDTPERMLRTRGETLRIRQYGQQWIVTHKAPKTGSVDQPHKQRLETETTITNGDTVAQIFASLGYIVSFVYEKWRAEYSDGVGHLVLDETPIGTFAELEGSADWIDAIAAQLGIAAKDYIPESYARLFFDWKQEMKNSADNMTFAEVAAGASR